MGEWARRWRLNGLRARMAVILACVLLLPTGYAILQAFVLYHENRSWLMASLERTAALIASHHSELFNETHLLLRRLAIEPDIAAVRPPRCAALLQTELEQTRSYGNFAVVDPNGIVQCSPVIDLVGVGVADRAWFQRIRDDAGFAISEVLYARDGRGRTVVAAVPLPRGPDGAFTGALAATVDLAVLGARMRGLSLPEDALVVLSDERGQLLAGTDLREGGAVDGWPSSAEIALLIGDAAATEVAAADGAIERRFITARIGSTRLHVVLGLPILDEWSWLERDLLLGLFAPSVILALAIVAIWIATDLLVNRHVAALARTAQTYGGGRLTELPPLGGAPGELRDLGAALAKMARRIGEREEELKQSLEQKDVLLREIHHRVKNNLQIVTSLLNLRIQAIPSPAAQQAMLEAQTRIKALALVHRSLYEHHDHDRVDLASLIGELCQLLHDGADPASRPVTLRVELAPVQVTTEKAIPITLLVTECVTNSLKHAFPGGRGTIDVRLVCDGPACRLTVADDGIGIEASRAARGEAGRAVDGPAGTVGLKLIEMLTKQIGGRLQIDGPPGTVVAVTFDA